jgi:hypothetical protein
MSDDCSELKIYWSREEGEKFKIFEILVSQNVAD